MKVINLLKFSFFIVLLYFSTIISSYDPYKILNVDRKASTVEIRKAYKHLVKEWHPDKSDKPDAESKFVEIKQAYELLSDVDRRKAYDLHGITNEDSHLFRDPPDYSQYGRMVTDPFEEFFGQRFQFDQDISIFHKLSITTNYFESNILPKSQKIPHIIMFYSDWCFSCMKAASSFKKLIDTLEPLGIVFATVNAGHENSLLRKMSVHSLPCIVLVMDEKSYVYKESVSSIQKIVEFIRMKMPYKLISNVKDDNIEQFLSGWSDNKVRTLIFEPRNQPRLRYLITAFQFRHRVAFGFVHISSSESKQIQERFKIHPNLDSVMVFNEDSSRPAASVSMSDIPTQTLINIIQSNQFLALPRLSSQGILEGVCPPEWNPPRKRLCVILVTEKTDLHDPARQALRKIALESGYNPERVRFAYIYQDSQTEFVSALAGEESQTLLRVVIIWRRDTSHIKYEWLTGTTLHIHHKDNETSEHNYNSTKQKLDDTIQRLLKTTEALSYETKVKDLLDEHAQSLLTRIINKCLIAIDYLMDNIGKEHILPALSIVGTIAFILGVGYLMAHLVRIEEENIQKKENKSSNGTTTKGSTYVPELKLHELRAEKYNGLVRLLKPGCRTIVLITDLQSRQKLIPAYHAAVWPYRRNKTLMFAHMLIEKGLNWYSEILRLSLSESRDLSINPRNCVGTVLALNGHRKYFCMYHAKHPETNRGTKRMLKMTRQLSSTPYDPEAGAFLGMESESDSDINESDEPTILLEENLLDGLSNWLDRLFEGTTHRYYLNYWPDFTTK